MPSLDGGHGTITDLDGIADGLPILGADGDEVTNPWYSTSKSRGGSLDKALEDPIQSKISVTVVILDISSLLGSIPGNPTPGAVCGIAMEKEDLEALALH